MFDQHIVFLDLETTGGSAAFDRIIEIGLIEVNRGVVVAEWSTLINPGRRIPHGIQVLTGITDEMAASAPTFAAVSDALARRLEGKVLAAHNARFDYGFLKGEFQRQGMRYVAPVLCTVKLSRRLFPQHPRHNLDALIVRHSLFCLDRHRALGDARAIWELAQIWNRDPGGDVLGAACTELLRRPTLPAALPPDLPDTLPELPGVYLFHGDDDAVLFVGKCANIRSGVLLHFADQRPARDLKIAQAVRRVSWIETAGELGAHFEHARLVRNLAPEHNVRARSESWSWLWRSDAPDIPPRLVGAHEIDAFPVEHLYGAFRSRSIATTALRELARAWGLCRVLLGLESADPAGCSGLEAGSCRGACAGRESAIAHAIRAVQALNRLRLKPWPYRGRIAVRERDAYTGRLELHVVERWRHLGTAYSEAELHELAQDAAPGAFDLDTYKALVRILKAPPRNCDVLVLGPTQPTGDRCNA